MLAASGRGFGSEKQVDGVLADLYLVLVGSSLVKLIKLRVVSFQSGVLIQANTADLPWLRDPSPSHVTILLINHVSRLYSPSGFGEQMASQRVADYSYAETLTAGRTLAHPTEILLI